jgi:hypothetical protein
MEQIIGEMFDKLKYTVYPFKKKGLPMYPIFELSDLVGCLTIMVVPEELFSRFINSIIGVSNEIGVVIGATASTMVPNTPLYDFLDNYIIHTEKYRDDPLSYATRRACISWFINNRTPEIFRLFSRDSKWISEEFCDELYENLRVNYSVSYDSDMSSD